MSAIIILIVIVSIISTSTESSGGSVANLGSALLVVAMIGLVIFIVKVVRYTGPPTGGIDKELSDFRLDTTSDTPKTPLTPVNTTREVPLRKWSDEKYSYEEWEETISYYEDGKFKTEKKKHTIKKPK